MVYEPRTKPIAPYTPQVQPYRSKVFTDWSDRNPYDDPYAINSLSDVFLNIEGLERRTGKEFTPVLSNLEGLVHYVSDSYLSPLKRGEFSTVFVNSLNAIGEDIDVLANAAKGAVLNQDDPGKNILAGVTVGVIAGVGILATGGGLLPAVGAAFAGTGIGATGSAYLSDPLKAFEGTIKGLGLGQTGKHNYYMDSGNFLADLAFEVAIDPFNWVSFGVGALKNADLTRTAKKVANTFELDTKSVAHGVKLLARDTTDDTLKNYIKATIGEGRIGEVMNFLNEDMAWETVRAMSKIIDTSESVEKFILKSSFAMTPFGAARMVYKYGNTAGQYISNKLLEKANKYKVSINRVDIFEVDNMITEMKSDLKTTAKVTNLDKNFDYRKSQYEVDIPVKLSDEQTHNLLGLSERERRYLYEDYGGQTYVDEIDLKQLDELYDIALHTLNPEQAELYLRNIIYDYIKGFNYDDTSDIVNQLMNAVKLRRTGMDAIVDKLSAEAKAIQNILYDSHKSFDINDYNDLVSSASQARFLHFNIAFEEYFEGRSLKQVWEDIQLVLSKPGEVNEEALRIAQEFDTQLRYAFGHFNASTDEAISKMLNLELDNIRYTFPEEMTSKVAKKIQKYVDKVYKIEEDIMGPLDLTRLDDYMKDSPDFLDRLKELHGWVTDVHPYNISQVIDNSNPDVRKLVDMLYDLQETNPEDYKKTFELLQSLREQLELLSNYVGPSVKDDVVSAFMRTAPYMFRKDLETPAQMVIKFLEEQFDTHTVIDDAFDFIIDSVGSDKVYKLMMNKRTSRLSILAGLSEETYKALEDIGDETTPVGSFFKLFKELDEPGDVSLRVMKNLTDPVYTRTRSTLNYIKLFNNLNENVSESYLKIILTNLENKARLEPYTVLDDVDNLIKDIIKQKNTLADNLGIATESLDASYLKGVLYEYLSEQGKLGARTIDTVDGYYGHQFQEIGKRLYEILEREKDRFNLDDLKEVELRRLSSEIFDKEGNSPIFDNIKQELTNIKQINNSLSYGYLSPEELKKVTNLNAYDFVNNSHRWAVQTIYKDPMFPKIWDELNLSRISSYKMDEMYRGIIEELYKFADQSTQTTKDYFSLKWAEGLKEVQDKLKAFPESVQRLFLGDELEEAHKVALLRLMKKYEGYKHIMKNPSYSAFRGLFPKVDVLQKRLDEAMQPKYALYQLKEIVSDPAQSKYLDNDTIRDIIRRLNIDDSGAMNDLVEVLEGWMKMPSHSPEAITKMSGKIRRYISENIGQLKQLQDIVDEVNFLKKTVDYNFERNFSRNVYTKKLSTLFSLDAQDTARLIKHYTPGFIMINKNGVSKEYLDKFLSGLKKTGLSDYGLAIKNTDDIVWVYKDQNIVSDGYRALDGFKEKIKLDTGEYDDRLKYIMESLRERMEILEMQSGSAIKNGDPIVYPFAVDATDPNILYKTNLEELIEKMPKSVREAYESTEDFIEGHLLNHVTYGTIKGYKDIHPYVASNYFKSLIDASSSLAKTSKAKVKYIELFFKDEFSLDTFSKTLSTQETYEVLKQNKRNLHVAVLTDVNGKPRVKEFFVNSPKDVAIAKKMDAVVLPTAVFNIAYKDINDYKQLIKKVPLLDMFNKLITNTYRTMFLMTSGFVSRNFLDTVIKNTAEYGSIADMPKAIQNMYAGFAAYKFYSEVQAEIITKGKGVFNKNSALVVLKDLTPEERSLYILIDNIVSSPAADTQIGEYAKLIRKYNMEQADVDVDIISEIQFQNPVSRRIFEVNSYVELSARIGMIFDEIARTMNPESGINKAIYAHFDYSTKSKAATIGELFIPFLTFPLKNLSYWVDKAVDAPHIMKLLLDMQNTSWNSDEEYSYYSDVERYRSVQYHTTAGNLRFGELVFKLNPSFYDAANLLTRPQDELMNRLVPPVKYGVDKLMDNNPDLSNIAPWAGTARNLNKIIHGDPYNEGERGLHTQIPSMFSTIYTHTPWNYNNYQYSYYRTNYSRYYPRTYLPYNFYQRLYSKAGNPRKDLRMSVATPQNLAYKIYDIQARIR